MCINCACHHQIVFILVHNHFSLWLSTKFVEELCLCSFLKCFINLSNSIIITSCKSTGYWKYYKVAYYYDGLKRKLCIVCIAFLYRNTLDTCLNSLSKASMLKEEEHLEYQILYNLAMAFLIGFVSYHASPRYILCFCVSNLYLILSVLSCLLHIP